MRVWIRPVEFRGDALERLRGFPQAARRELGFQIHRVQFGRDPADWKPMREVGPGVREIRVREDSGAFRAIYLSKHDDAVYVLHCFEKKSQKTPKKEIELARSRHMELLEIFRERRK